MEAGRSDAAEGRLLSQQLPRQQAREAPRSQEDTPKDYSTGPLLLSISLVRGRVRVGQDQWFKVGTALTHRGSRPAWEGSDAALVAEPSEDELDEKRRESVE